MLERTYIPLGSGRLQREILVVPPKKDTIPSGSTTKQYEQEGNNPPVAGLLNPPAGQKVKRVIAELEKRRAELFTIALEATARAQEADQKRAEAEAIARAALEKVHKVEKLFFAADAGAADAVERRLVFGLLVFANDKEKKRRRKASNKQISTQAQLTARQPSFLEYEMQGNGFKDRLKFMGYGLATALVILGAGWLILEFLY
ncbi:MAG: hypothetical protein J2P21_19125 [Chloracidobacterium sp.]|nr:hypothetical protein [Chloracidobacterium sp.]